MRRKNLSIAKKGIAVAIASTMVLSQGGMAFAEDVTETVDVRAYEADESKDVDGNVTVTTSDEYAVAGVISNSDNGHEAKVTVSGDVSVTIEKEDSDEENYGGLAVGVEAISGDKSSNESDASTSKSTVTVDGAVKASNEVGGTAVGINIEADEKGEVTIFTGDVSVSGDEALGIEAVGSGDITVTTGGISTSGGTYRSNGIEVMSSGGTKDDPTNYKVEVNGDIKSEGDSANGIIGLAGEYSDVNVNVKGGIYVDLPDQKSNSENEKSYLAEPSSSGIELTSAGKATVTVSGGITSDGEGIVVRDGYSYSASKEGTAETKNPEISVVVGKDVTVSGTAVEVTKTDEKSNISIEVDGTIKGEHNLVIDEVYQSNYNKDTRTSEKVDKTSETIKDGLSVTVWKIDTSKTNGRTAELKTNSYDSKAGKTTTTYQDFSNEAAAFIDYIIKVDEVKTAGGNLVAGSDKAREGETVNLEVTVPAGYSIDSFYTGEDGTNVEVKKDASTGKYYIVVPRGGGVFVGVKMRAYTSRSSSSNDNSSDDGGSSSNSNNKQAGGFVDNAGNIVNLGEKVSASKSIMVNGQKVDADISLAALDAGMAKAFADSLGMVAVTGMFDASGIFVQVPSDAVIKDSFSFTADGLNGFVTTYLDVATFKAGDVIMCSYIDAFGNPVLVAITPDMINGTALLLTIPAHCTLAIAGREV